MVNYHTDHQHAALSSHAAAAYTPLEFSGPVLRHHSKDKMSKRCFFNHRDVTLETFESDISEDTRSPLSLRPCSSLLVITKVITDLTRKNPSFVPEVLRLYSSPLAFINFISTLVPHAQAEKLQIPPVSCISHKLITKTNVQKSINHISHTVHQATMDSYLFDPGVQQETDFHIDPGNNTSSSHIFLSLSMSCKESL